jgi:hypothetical protein
MDEAIQTEVVLSVWEVLAADADGKGELVYAQCATKREALFEAMNVLASGCTVRVVWRLS